MRVLYVEDEKRLAMAIERILTQNNFSVDVRNDGEEGLDCALTGDYDVIVLDIMLPGMDGIGVLRELRRKGVGTPVLMLTAKSELEDKILGLDCGADDYLAKPFQTGELLARLRALSRRKTAVYSGQTLIFEDIELNPHTLDLYCGSKSFRLTLKESQLLETLIGNKGMCVSPDLIIRKLWGYDSEATDSNVQVYIAFLRKKLSALDSRVKIRTIRGAGYTLQPGTGGGEETFV